MEPITIKINLAIEDIDFLTAGILSEDPNHLEQLHQFLTDELHKAGGSASIAVDQEQVIVEWFLPETIGEKAAYVAHVLQVGLLKDPLTIIANTVYSGGLQMLGMDLLCMGTMRLNPYLAERDARFMVMAAPFSASALSILGIILLENGKSIEAAEYLKSSCEFFPNDFFANKWAGIALTLNDPVAAVKSFERCIQLLAKLGEAPDAHIRTSYGMALRSAGMKAEAEIQFMLVCGKKDPAMSLSQWMLEGYKMKTDSLVELLKAEPVSPTGLVNHPEIKPKKARKKKA